MQVLQIKDGDGSLKAAVHVNEVPCSDDDLRELVELLMGRHDASQEALRDVQPGTVPDNMGAKKLVYLTFEVSPKSDGRPCSGGVYAVQEWVSDILDKAMPDGWGAAMTQPMMFPLVAYVGETFEMVGHFDYLGAEDNGRRVANGVIVSPMERAKTGPVTGNAIRDFDALEGAPTLLPLH